MSELTTVDEILNFAIKNEEYAHDLYMDLAKKAKSSAAKASFESFAKEEQGHKVKLQNVKSGKKLLSSATKVQDLKISDYTVDVTIDDNSSYQDILIFAMKIEKAAYRMYMELSDRTDDADLRDLLISLANEEAKHKLRFEIEYDEHVLVEN